MSKKCCGIIYKDEKFCTMCGKALADLPDIDEQDDKKEETSTVLDMAEVDKITASVLGDKTAEKEEGNATETSEQPPELTEDVDDDKDESQDNSKETDEVEDKTEDKTEETSENVEKDDDDDDDDGTASGGLKFFGTLMIILMLVAIAAVGLGVYFIMLNPFYKNHDINNPVVYEQMATDTDVTNIQTRPVLSEVSIEPATPTDASEEDMATESDASATDLEEVEEVEEAEDADVSQDEE